MNRRWRWAQFFELYWWKNYLGPKQKMAYLNWKRAYWTQFLQKNNIKWPEGARILDAGCGPAGIFTVLPEGQVDALDPLLEQYAGNLPHFAETDYPGVHFICMPLESFQAPEKYDMVFCLNAINHVAHIDTCLSRLAAALAPGGQLILSVDTHKFAWLRFAFQQVPADILHPQQFMLDDYITKLENRHLRVQRTHLLQSGRIFDYQLLIASKANPE